MSEMGKHIVQSQLKYLNSEFVNRTKLREQSENSSCDGTNSTMWSQKEKVNSHVDMNLRTSFIETDILLLQEVVIEEEARQFLDILHSVYPYAVYDVTEPGVMKANDGLVVVSKYPI